MQKGREVANKKIAGKDLNVILSIIDRFDVKEFLELSIEEFVEAVEREMSGAADFGIISKEEYDVIVNELKNKFIVEKEKYETEKEEKLRREREWMKAEVELEEDRAREGVI